MNCLGGLVQGGALLDCDEPLDSQVLPGLLESSRPSLDVLVGLPSGCMLLLGDDLACLNLHQIGLLETTAGLGSASKPQKHHRLCARTLRDEGNLLRLLDLHCLHKSHFCNNRSS